MIRAALALALLAPAAAGCTSMAPIHALPQAIPQGKWAWCMLPGGEITSWTSGGGPGSAGATCAPPARFVIVRVCGDGEVPPDESLVVRAARVRLSRDNSLVGDSFGGRPFCAPTPPS